MTPRITTTRRTRSLAHPGHFAVDLTPYWVSRHFDGFAVVHPDGRLMDVVPSLLRAAEIAVEHHEHDLGVDPGSITPTSPYGTTSVRLAQ